METVTPDTFNPPHHELSNAIQHELDTLLKDYEYLICQEQNLNWQLHLSLA